MDYNEFDNKKFYSEYKKFIGSDANEFKKIITDIFRNSSDLIVRSIITEKGNIFFVCIDGLVDKALLDGNIIRPLSEITKKESIENMIQISQLESLDINLEFVTKVLDGNVAIISENENNIFIADLKHWAQRGVEPPDTEITIRGPKESFTETLRVNTSLIRRKIKSPNLVIENLRMGKQTKTIVALCYINGVVNKDALEKLKLKLSKIHTDAMLESGYIEQYIEERPLLLFPTVGSTQKPDVAAAKILEGRIAIICDGTPFVATIPHLFIENLQSAEDYYHRPFLASFLRLIRFIALIIALLLPAMYVAIATYHQEMIPTVLLESIASATADVPFPKAFECFLMLVIFEILRESGTRLPKNIGSAVSIMGAIVIGQVAVQAGLVSAPMVIVISITALSSFIITSLTEFITIYRFILLLFGSILGLVGVCSVTMIILAQLCSTESFGVPYLTITNANNKIKDFLIRFPLKTMIYRPNKVAQGNTRRQGE